LKPVLTALISASLAAVPLAAAAQHHGGGHSGGGSWSGHAGPAGAPSAGGAGSWHGGSGSWVGRSGGAWAGHSGGWHGGGWHGGGWHGGGFRGGFRHFGGGGYPFFGGFGLGLAFGSAWSPWGWDYPYYGYPAYTVVEHDYYPDQGYYYDRYQRDYDDEGPLPPPGERAAAPPPAACGHWSWNSGASRYDWISCDAPPPPPPR